MSETETIDAKHHHEVTLGIATPKGHFKGVFDVKTTVAAVIEVVVDEKHLNKKDTFELVHDGKELVPTNQTLKSFGLHGHEKCQLVAQGTGV
jgi:hypothetical protein